MGTNILVCVALFAVASAVPLNIRDDFDAITSDYQCARQCKDNPNGLKYQPSHTYVYEYKAETETRMAGASEDTAKMQIQTHANIEVISQCEFALRLQNVEVYHSEPYSSSLKPAEQTQEFQRALTENTLRFSFDNGVIRDICHSVQEKIWVLNFKRGLLSAFQNSKPDVKTSEKVKEVDVSGECQVKYDKTKDWSWGSSIKVTKSKNLHTCAKHDGMRTLIPMVPYTIPSEIQSVPIMKTSHECKYTIDSNGLMSHVSCEESHIFAPFSKHQSGATTKVQQTLTFKTIKREIETSQDFIEARSTLIFQHMNGIENVQNSREAAEQKLKELCEQTKTDIRPETPRLFSEFVRIIKDLDISDLKSLDKMIKNNRLCAQRNKARGFFLDTLPIAGTSAAVKMMVSVINHDDINDVEKQVWLTSLSLIPEPSEDMLPSLMKLLNGDFAEQSLLPVSSLLNTMCKKNVDCENSYAFKKLVKKVNQNIDSYCSSDNKQQMMMTLRAIGNIGYGKDFLDTLRTCLKSNYAPLEYKVAAADAYRRFSCQDDEENESLFEIFEAERENDELRIMSFLSLMRCPKDSVLKKIADQLQREENVNVGTFVYTYLTNLKATSDPHKQDIAQAVKELTLKTFDDGGMKASRNIEFSNMIERLNLGYVADSNLIWAESSSIPRAAKVNLTVEMFGNSINLFEAGARVEGLDHFIEKYFGNPGYFPLDKDASKDLKGFLFARVFGNELFFKNVDVDAKKDLDKVLSSMNLEKMLSQLSHDFDYKYSHTQQLIDQSLIIPTAIGLPLNLTINSSVAVSTEASGQIDLRGILSRSKQIIVSSDVSASAGLEVTGSMLVDAHFYKQGLRMRNTLHSSINFKPRLTISNREIFNLDIQSPENSQELFDARSEFYIIHDNFEKKQEMIKENRQKMNACTGQTFSKVTGLELCGELQYPNASMTGDAPYFPFTGPCMAKLILNKKDTQRSYKLFAKWIKNSKSLQTQLIMDTPGSRQDRHISADVSLGFSKQKNIDIVLLSPWKKLLINGKAAQDDDLKFLTGSVIIDDNKKYKWTSKLKINKKGNRMELRPFVEIENDAKRITLLSGVVVSNELKDFSADLELMDLDKTVYIHQSKITSNKNERSALFSIGEKEKEAFKAKIGYTIKRKGNKRQLIKVEPELSIQTPRGIVASVTSSAEFQPKPLKLNVYFKTEAMRMKIPVVLKVDVKQKKDTYPVMIKASSSIFTGDVKGKINVRKVSYSGDMKMNYRTSSWKDRVTWNGKFLDKSKNTYAQYIVMSNLRFLKMEDYNTESNLKITHKKKSTFDLTVKYGKKSKNADNKKVIKVFASGLANVKNIKQAEIEADLKATMPEKHVDIKMTFDHQHTPRKVDSEVKIHFAPLLYKDINAKVSIQNKGNSLSVITGNGKLELGKDLKYNLDSSLIQKSKRRFDHTLTLSSNKNEKHSLVTIYKENPKDHEIKSDITSTLLENPLQLSMTIGLKELFDLRLKGSLNDNKKDILSFEALSKLDKWRAGKWKLAGGYEERKMKASASFNKINSSISTNAMVNWDLNSKQKRSPEIQLNGQVTYNCQSVCSLINSDVKITSPFKNFEKLATNIFFEKTESELITRGKVDWGGLRKKISSELSAELPISVKNAKVSFNVQTPFKNYKEFELEIDHMLNTELNSAFKGKVNNKKSELVVTGKKKVEEESLNINGQVVLKTPYMAVREIVMKVSHSADEKTVTSFMEVDKDGDVYRADLSNSENKDQERKGRLELSFPKRKVVESTYVYKNEIGNKAFEVSIESKENRRKQFSVDIGGAYTDISHMKLNVDIDYPQTSMKKASFEFENTIDAEELHSKVIAKYNQAQIGHDIQLTKKDKEIIAKAALFFNLVVVPEYDEIRLLSRIQYATSPVTVSTQLTWGQSSTIDFTGSYKADSLDDMELHFKLTTPFEKVENINFIASHVLKKSLRVSHLNIDYAVGKMIDIEIQNQNNKLKKLVRVKMSAPCIHFKTIDFGILIDMTKKIFSKADFLWEVKSNKKYEGFVSFSVAKNDKVKGKISLKTPIEGLKETIGKLEYQASHFGKSFLTLSQDNEKLFDIIVNTVRTTNGANVKVIVRGSLLEEIVEKYEDNILSVTPIFLPKLKKDLKGNMIKKIITEFDIKNQEQSVQMDASTTFDYYKSQRYTSVSIKKTGDKLEDFEIELLLTDDKENLKGTIALKFVDDIIVRAVLEGPTQDKTGIEFSHSGSLKNFETEGKLFFDDKTPFSGKVEFYMSTIQHIKLKLSTKLPVEEYEDLALSYTHEGQENRASCSLSVEDAGKVVGSIDMVAERTPIHLFSLTVKTPFKKYQNMVINGNYDETKMNALVRIRDNEEIYLSADHDNFKNPKFTLKTPLDNFKMLTVNVDGNLLDGSSSFAWQLNDYDQIEGSVDIKYEDLSKMAIKADFNSKIDQSENKMKLEADTAKKPNKVMHFLLSFNDQNKVKFDAKQEKLVSGEERNVLDVELLYPVLDLKTNGLILKVEGNQEKSSGKIELLDDSTKMLEADISVNTKDQREIVITVKEPKPMVYKITQEHFPELKNDVIYFNWDKSDPDASLTIQSIVKDHSSSYKTDKSMTLRASCSRRSLGVKHSVIATKKNVESSGAVFWDDDSNSEVSYYLNVNDKSNRYGQLYDGEFKVKVPTRSVGFTGLLKNDATESQMLSTFSWDMERDTTKKVGVKATLQKRDHNAEISLILPKETHVNSKLIFNKGNTIVEGETQIIYSPYSRKTLTLFSKLENNPGYNNFFYSEDKYNYSIQLGMSHPESRLDVKMVSHIGVETDRLTTSIGFDYLTSRKQKTNLALFGEINRLKREINLYAATPYKNIGVSGAIISKNPLEVKAVRTFDGKDETSAYLLIHPSEQRAQVKFMDYGQGFSLSTHRPNNTAMQIEINHHQNDIADSYANFVAQLSTPKLLQTSLQWRPGLLVALRDWHINGFKQRTIDFKEFADQVSQDIEVEFIRKYGDIVRSIYKEGKSAVAFLEEELNSLEIDLDQLQTNMEEDIDFCSPKLGDYEMEHLVEIQMKVKSLKNGIKTSAKSFIKTSRVSLKNIVFQLENMKNYPVKDALHEVVENIMEGEFKLFKTPFIFVAKSFAEYFSMEELKEFWESLDELVEKNLNPQPLIDELNKRMEELRNFKISDYLDQLIKKNTKAANKIKSFMADIKKDIDNDPLTFYILVAINEISEELLHQVISFYQDYSIDRIDRYIPTLVDDVVSALNEAIEDEVKEQLEAIHAVIHNPITQFDAQQGILKAEFPLPVSINVTKDMIQVSQ